MKPLRYFKIWVQYHVREFLGINREIAQINRDIRGIMEKELDRDRQYPVEDVEALSKETA